MTKIVINTDYGGFGLSTKATERLRELGVTTISEVDIPRDNPKLVRIVRELGTDANGAYAKLVVVEIPDGIEWTIEEYDGSEWISEAHRMWDKRGEIT